MPRAPIRPFVCTDKTLERGLNVLVAELNRLGKWSTDGNIGFSNGQEGPKQWLNVPPGSALRRAFSPPAGIAAYSGTTGPASATCFFAKRSGNLYVPDTISDTFWNDHPDPIPGDRLLRVYRDESGRWFVLTHSCSAFPGL